MIRLISARLTSTQYLNNRVEIGNWTLLHGKTIIESQQLAYKKFWSAQFSWSSHLNREGNLFIQQLPYFFIRRSRHRSVLEHLNYTQQREKVLSELLKNENNRKTPFWFEQEAKKNTERNWRIFFP